MEITPETKRLNRLSREQIQNYRELALEYIANTGDKRQSLLDIGRAIIQPGEAIHQVMYILRKLKAEGKIAIYNGSKIGYWTISNKKYIKPTYEPPKKVVDVVKTPSEKQDVVVSKVDKKTVTLPGITITINITR